MLFLCLEERLFNHSSPGNVNSDYIDSCEEQRVLGSYLGGAVEDLRVWNVENIRKFIRRNFSEANAIKAGCTEKIKIMSDVRAYDGENTTYIDLCPELFFSNEAFLSKFELANYNQLQMMVAATRPWIQDCFWLLGQNGLCVDVDSADLLPEESTVGYLDRMEMFTSSYLFSKWEVNNDKKSLWVPFFVPKYSTGNLIEAPYADKDALYYTSVVNQVTNFISLAVALSVSSQQHVKVHLDLGFLQGFASKSFVLTTMCAIIDVISDANVQVLLYGCNENATWWNVKTGLICSEFKEFIKNLQQKLRPSMSIADMI